MPPSEQTASGLRPFCRTAVSLSDWRERGEGRRMGECLLLHKSLYRGTEQMGAVRHKSKRRIPVR